MSEIRREGTDLELFNHAKFCKNRLRGFAQKVITKITNFYIILIAVCPYFIFKAASVEFGVRLRTWDSLPMPNFVKKYQLKEFVPYGQIYTKIYKF